MFLLLPTRTEAMTTCLLEKLSGPLGGMMAFAGRALSQVHALPLAQAWASRCLDQYMQPCAEQIRRHLATKRLGRLFEVPSGRRELDRHVGCEVAILGSSLWRVRLALLPLGSWPVALTIFIRFTMPRRTPFGLGMRTLEPAPSAPRCGCCAPTPQLACAPCRLQKDDRQRVFLARSGSR